MTDFIAACVSSPVNLTLSVLLALTTLYWLVVLLGAAGLDSLDFDFDPDVDVDIDVTLDADAASGSGSGGDAGLLAGGPVAGLMRFLHVGSVPVLILWSVFVLCLWFIGVVTWPWLGGWSTLLQLLAVVPFAVFALLATKVLTLPLKALFDKMEAQHEAENHTRLLGRRCTITSLTADPRGGQASIDTDGAPLLLYVRTRDPDVVLNKGDEAVLVGEDKARRLYFVQKF